MKKNLWFKLGLFCTALVLVATCFISSAWAKYTSSTTLTDTARVAKFDVAMPGTAQFNLFDTKLTNIVKDGAGVNAVSDENVIAPGSHGEYTFVISNSGEVAVSFTFTVTDTNTSSIPLKFKVEGSTTEYTTFADAVAEAFSSAGTVIGAGEEDNSISKKIIWSWDYDGDDTDFVAGTAEYTVNVTINATQVMPA